MKPAPTLFDLDTGAALVAAPATLRPEPGVKPETAGCGDLGRSEVPAVSDPGPWPPPFQSTYTRAAARGFFARHPVETGEALMRRGVGYAALDVMEPRALLALDREVLNAVAPGACVVAEGVARPARPRAVTSAAGIQSVPSTPKE